MFGYVRAIPSLLSAEDAKRYEGVYCGLCRTLGERYGWTARCILNYDFVFLAILLAEPETTGCFKACACPIHPWKKKACWLKNPVLETAADKSLILTWWKLQDAVQDGNAWERTKAKAAMLPLKRHYRKAAGLCPSFDATVQTCLAQLHEMEREWLPSLDRPADTFARILQAAATETQPPARQSGIGQMLYHVGRWIYLIDAWDDLEEDRKKGSYNPLLARFGSEVEENRAMLRETMHTSLGLVDTAFSLLDWGEWEPLLGHILALGLPAVEESVFTGQWKKTKQREKQQRQEQM